MSSQASVTVDIQAKIVGYQQEIETIKAALKNMRVDTSIGKDLSKSLQMVEKEVDNLSKHMNQRLSSDTQITNFTDKLNQVEEAFIRMGQLMSNTSFNDLDLSKIDGEFKELINDIDAAKAALAEKTESGFKTAVEDSKTLAKAFNRLGIDMSTLSSAEIGTTLSKNLENLTTKIEEARGRLKEINQDIENLKQQQNDLSNKPILQIGDISKEVEKILGSKDELGFNTQINQDAVKQLSDRINSAFNTAKPIAEEKKNEINNILKSIGGSGTKEEVAKHLDELIAKIREVKLLSATGLGGGKTGSQLAEKMFSDIFDESKLDEALAKIRQRMTEDGISEADIEKMIPGIKTNLLENNLKGAQDIIKKNLTDTKKDTEKLIADINNQLEQLGAEQKTLKSEKAKDEYTKRTVEAAQTDYDNIIKQLQAENADLKQRVEALEKTREEKRAEALSRIHGSGRQVENKSKIGFNENIEGAKAYRTELEQVQAKEKLIGKIEGVVQRWFSIYAAVRMVGNAIRSVISTVQELDKTITEIAIVTDMTQNDLWGQMKSYTDMAREYAASISGVYQVSQLYYQQGLQTADVMALTEQTLKMARISGLDYAQATDYMTNAVRSFKMEMTDAQNVVDVYSAIAASSATSTSELASAMSKTASSAEAVGSSFENTTAMMAVMIEATRESPENIGSAMKSIISRYGEMTADPNKLVDSEGQEMSLNKVDKALQSVGITLQDTNHQFRDFDDVITELAGKWDTIDKNTQRYIATVMAGNRQQSRFLALVSSGERLEELSEIAANSEDAATLQVLKTMDSIEAKSQQLKTSLQSLYTSTGIQNLFKGFLDVGNQIVKTFTQMPTVFGAPIPAILKIGTTFASLANVVTTVFGLIKAKTQAQIAALNGQEQAAAAERVNIAGQEITQKMSLEGRHEVWYQTYQDALTKYAEKGEEERLALAAKEAQAAEQLYINNMQRQPGGITKKTAGAALGLNIAGVALSTISGAISDKTQSSKLAKGWTGVAGSALSMAGMGTMIAPGWGTAIGAGVGVAMGLVENLNFLMESAEAKAQRLKEVATEANNNYLQKKNDYTSYQEEINKLKELEKARYDSEEANKEFIESSNRMAEQHPELITAFDSEGNAVLDLASTYNTLEEARKAAIESGKETGLASVEYQNELVKQAKERKENIAGEAEGSFQDVALDEKNLLYYEKAARNAVKFYLRDELNVIGEANEEGKDFSYKNQEQLDNINRAIDSMLQGLIYTAEKSFSKAGLTQEQIEQVKGKFNNLNSQEMTPTTLTAVQSLYSGEADFLDQIILAINEERVDDAKKLINDNKNNLKDLDKQFNSKIFSDFLRDLENYSGVIFDADNELKKAEENRNIAERTGIAREAQSLMYGDQADFEKNTEYFKDFSEVNNLISGYMYQQFKEHKEKLQKAFDNGDQDVTEEDLENVYSDWVNKSAKDTYEEINTWISDLWEKLSTSSKQAFNELLKNNANYSRTEFEEKLKDFGANDELIAALSEQYYAQAYNYGNFVSAIVSRQNDQKNYRLTTKKYADTLRWLGADELQTVLEVYDTVASQIENKQITPEIGQDILNNYLAIWEITNSMQGNSKDLAQKMIQEADFSSLTGLNDFRQQVNKEVSFTEQQKKDLIEAAENTTNLMPVNFAAELQSFSQKITSNMENFEKAISNAAKGMDLKTATELAQKIGKTLGDFNFKDGKFFFDDFAAIRDVYLGENEQYIEDLKIEAEKQQNKFKNGKAEDATGNISGILMSLQGKTLEGAQKYLDLVPNSILNAGFSSEEILSYYQQYLNDAEKGTQDFVTWVQEHIGKELADNIEAVNNYTNDQIARSALSVGDFTNFLDQVLPSNSRENAEKRAQLQLFLKSGNIDSVLASFPGYASDILKYYQDINKNVYDKLISGLDSQQYINADEFSAETLQSLETAGLVKKISGEGSKAIYKTLDKMTNEQLDLFAQTVVNSNLIKADKDKMLASIHTEKYEDNIYEGLSGVADNFDKFSYEAGQKLANSLGTSVENLINTGIINVDEVTGDLSISYEQMRSYLASNMHNMTIKQYNELRAKLETKASKEDSAQIFNNIVQNRNKLSEDNIAALGTILDKGYIAVTNMLQRNADGTYTLDLATIQQLINNGQVKINEELKQLIANEIDTIISSLTGLGTLQNKGTISIEDMQKRVAAINQQLGQNFSMQDLFVYDEQLNAFVYSAQGLQIQAASLAAQLESLKSNTEANADEIWAVEQSMKNIAVQMANNIDFSSVLNLSIGDPSRNIKFDELRQAIEDYNTVLAEIGITTGLNTDNLIHGLRYGGENAVRAAEAIAKAQGKTLSAEDVEAAYRSQISNWANAIDTIIAQPGEIVDQATAEIIGISGGVVNELGGTGQFVVESAANLYEAYNNLLQQMALSGEATLADLNKVQALALENRLNENGTNEQQVIDALGDAAGMTFTRFGEILANAGIQLTEDMVNQLEAAGIIDLMGGNKMKIVDFQAFADLMNWDANSEEYVSAFKTYNDSLIDMNRQAERNILEEAQNVAGAKGGDWINITQLMSKLQEGFRYEGSEKISLGDSLAASIQKFGAKIEDGILKLDDSANIPAVLQMIAQAAAESGGLLSNELAELADAVADAIKGYADLIKGGIEGSLSNVQAEELQDWATANGIGQLDFTETKDGLKVATDQAFELVAALQQVDSMQGKLTFDSLVDSLSESKGGKFENISKTTAEIARLENSLAVNERELQELRLQGVDSSSKTYQNLLKQNSTLKEQINLARNIQQHQSIDPSQYNFMDRELPDVMQGPINYWNSVGKAYSALNETAKTGKMDIQDFTNIVNEMSNLAATSGEKLMFFGQEIDGSAENAAALIQKGYSALSNVDGKGVKVDLSKMGIDFASGADNAKNNFDKGIKSLADSQIAMLDAAIKVLEVVVAMEKLGDIDVDKDNQLDLGEIFNIDENTKEIQGFSEKYSEWADNIYDVTHDPKAENFNKDLAEGLESISINGNTMKDLIYAASKGVKEGAKAFEELNLSEQQYQTIINSFYQAMLNGDYNLDTIQDSVWDILDQTLPDGTTIEVGDRTIIVSGGAHFDINWQDPNIDEAFENLGIKKKGKEYTDEQKKALQESFERYYSGQGEPIDVETVLIYNNKVKIKDGKKVIIGPDGKEYGEDETGYEKALAANALADLTNTDLKQITYEGETPTTEITYPNKTKIKITYSLEDGAQYWGPDGEGPYNSEDAMFNDLYEKALTDFMGNSAAAENEYARNQAKNGYTMEMFLYKNFGITVRAGEVTVTDEKGDEVDPSKDPEVRRQLKEQLNNGEKGFQEMLETGDATVVDLKNGKVKVNIKGFGGIEVDKIEGESDEAAIQRAVMEALGVDESLVDNITNAITNAFTTVGEDGSNAIQQAITTAIQNAFKITELPEQEIPQITARITDLQITGVDNTTFGGLNALGSKFGISSNLTIPEATAKIGNLKISGADTVDTETFKTVGEKIAQAIQEGLASITLVPNVQAPTSDNPTPENGSTETTGGTVHSTAVIDNVDDTALQNSNISIKVPIEADPEAFNTTIAGLEQNITVKPQVPVDINPEAFNSGLITMTTEATKEVKKPVSFDGKLSSSYDTAFKNATSSVSKTVNFVGKLAQSYNEALKEATKDAEKKINFVKGTDSTGGVGPKAGNVALAEGQSGEALVRGRTLMGELGPELVVSNGRYYVVGQNGPEMVNLAPDAIVFNHLQTRQLLTNGRTGTHATPVTNEKKAVSFATGNATGPAMASASEALATLKQLRAMWESLRSASLKDLGAMGGNGGGGGGGGGGGDKKAAKYVAGILHDVEEWYNYLTEIEMTQTRINKLVKEYNLLDKQGISTQEKLNNLQARYSNLKSNRETRQDLIKGQTDARQKMLDQVTGKTKGPLNALGAFYSAGEDGRLLLADDKRFANYVAEHGNFTKAEKEAIQSSGKISMSVKQQTAYSQEDINAENDKSYKKWLKKQKKKGNKVTKKQKKAQKKKIKKNNKHQVGDVKSSKKVNVQVPASGLELANYLSQTDKYGNPLYSASAQYDMIKKLGFEEFMMSDENGNKLDTTAEGWQQTAVENFFAKIESGKQQIEELTDSINEQEQAALDDAIAMQEINDEIRELVKPIPGVTEGLEDWYNELKRIEAVQEKINILSKQNNIFQNDLIANGKAIYENYKAQREELKNQRSLNEDLFKKRIQERKDLVKKYNGLPIAYDATTGTATFSEEKINKTINTSYTDIKKVKKSDGNYYEVDEKGRYVDKNGVLRDKNGKELNPKEETFGQVQTKTIESTYNTNGKTLPEILTDITKQNATGKTAYNVEQQYDILKGLGLEKYLQYDESGNKIYEDFGELTKEQMEEAVKAGISRIQGAADEINEVTSDINKLTEDGLDIQASMYELDRMMIDNAIEVKNQLKDAIVQEHQDAIDEKNELKDAIQSSADKTVSGLRDSLEKERQVYDNQKSEEELSSLQRQLAIARRSGGSTATIRNLSQQVEDKQRDMYFTSREQQIDTLEEAANKQVEALEEQTNIMQTALDYQVKYGLIWDEVNNKLNTDSAAVITDYITQHMPEFLSANSEEQAKLYTEKLESVQLHLANINDENSPFLKMNQVEEDQLTKLTEMAAEIEAIKAKIPTTSSKDTTPEGNKDDGKATGSESQGGQNGGSDGKEDKTLKTGGGSAVPPSKPLTQEEKNQLRRQFESKARAEAEKLQKQGVQGARERVGGAAKAALDAYEKTSGNNNEKQAAASKAISSFLRGANNLESSEQPSNQPEEPTVDSVPVKVKKKIDYYSKPKANSKTKKAGTFKKGDTFNAIGLSKDATFTIAKGKKRYMLKFKKGKKTFYIPRRFNYLSYEGTNQLPKFAQGGKIDFTGPAWVDGSKSKPEQIFNFDQMQQLREMFLNNLAATQMGISGLSSIADSLPNTNAYNNISNEDNGVNIGQLDFHMEVQEISNDYDARRAGYEAMEEMVRIARKAGNRSISRR